MEEWGLPAPSATPKDVKISVLECQVALACNILDGSCFRADPSKTISVQVGQP